MPPPAEGLTSRLFLGPALRTQPDRKLVTLVRGGYEAAFEEIVRRYRRPLGRYAAAIAGGRSEDVTQDAFSKALLALRRDDAEIELRPWLYRIVRNTALNELRDRPPAAEILAEAIAGGRGPAEAAEQREELAELMTRLQALPEPQRAAIVMRELEGLGHEEIAAALGLSGGAARQAIYRARQALRDGVGMLLPLPLLRALIGHGAEAGAAGAGAGGVAVAAGASAGGAGAGGALKAGVVAAVLAGSVGTGIALEEDRGGRAADAATPVSRAGPALPAAPSAAPRPAPSGAVAARGDEERRAADSPPSDGAIRGRGGRADRHGDRFAPVRYPVHRGGHREDRRHGPGGDEMRRRDRTGPGPGSGERLADRERRHREQVANLNDGGSETLRDEGATTTALQPEPFEPPPTREGSPEGDAGSDGSGSGDRLRSSP